MRAAFGGVVIAAPFSFLNTERSYTWTWNPARRSAIAALRPASPAPTIPAVGLAGSIAAVKLALGIAAVGLKMGLGITLGPNVVVVVTTVPIAVPVDIVVTVVVVVVVDDDITGGGDSYVGYILLC